MGSRLALFASFVVAVGCGSFDAPAEKNEPSLAPASAPSSNDETAQSSETTTSQAANEPAPAGGSAGTTPKAPCKVGFQKDILPRLVATCGQSSCHAAELHRPFIDGESAQTTHDELMAFEFGSLEWSDPHSEYSGASVPDFKKAIDAWRMCGAPLD